MECLRDNFHNGVILDGRYQTLSPINHGSFGMVFMARDLHAKKKVAIKCLTKQAIANDAGIEFVFDDKSEEMALHKHLGAHPNIVNLLDSFETEAHLYLVLEYCEQGDLYEAIRTGHGPLETEHVRQSMLELVDAVAYIHSRGVYHRDIKPENIFLTKSGSMKLGDFGLATKERWTFESTVGSDRYMSPEQYDSAGAGYSPAQADIWAIGVCLLNILFSRNPFTTPTEADPLFLDFSRDKQSLFDVFPSMSQDTYEVIVQCMNMDPSKRSLLGARAALKRVISFTTMDEALDDFCANDRCIVASSNREPFRTPSIQSPQIDKGAFPWTKAFHASPQKSHSRPGITSDDGHYTEDLFSRSAATTADWMSGSVHTTSLSSAVDSSLGVSVQSFPGKRPILAGHSVDNVLPMAGSLPITMSMPRGHPSSSMTPVFGHKDTVSKSWCDMWEEDIEEEEQARQLAALKKLNSRTWSHESLKKTAVNDDDTPRMGLTPATRSAAPYTDHDIPSIDAALASNDIDEDLAADGFFFLDFPSPKHGPIAPARYSPPPKRINFDKWAALGERRRAYPGIAPEARSCTFQTARSPHKSRPCAAFEGGHVASALELGQSAHHACPFYQLRTSNHMGTTTSKLIQEHRTDGKDHLGKEGVWYKDRHREWNWNWNFDWRK